MNESHRWSGDLERSETRRMLLVEDDVELSTVLVRVARCSWPGLVVDWANGLSAARACLRARRYDAVLADLCLGDSDLGCSLRPLHTYRQPDSCFALMSARPLSELVSVAGDADVPILCKPFTTHEYGDFVRALIQRSTERRSSCSLLPR